MILLDTHALVWLAVGSAHLGPSAIQTIESARREDRLIVSAVSFWEIALLAKRGRLELVVSAADFRRGALTQGIGEIPLDGRIAIESVELADLPSDPADRFIAASAHAEKATLLTADEALLGCEAIDTQDARR